MTRGKYVDLTGQQIDEWTVLERTDLDDNRGTKYKCRCSCGTEKEVSADTLKKKIKGVKSCGCYRPVSVGDVYGEWTVLERIAKSTIYPKHTMFRCKCSCGSLQDIAMTNLTNGKTKRCRSCSIKLFSTVSKKGSYKYSENKTCYFIRSGDYVKIGASDNLEERIKTMQTNSPHELIILETFDNMNEETWHTIFAHRHYRGEWYYFPQTQDINI